MTKLTPKTAIRPTACQIANSKTRNIRTEDSTGREWLTDGKFAIRADVCPKLASRFEKLGIEDCRPRIQPVIDQASRRGFKAVSVDLDTIGVGSHLETYARKVGSAIIDARYTWLLKNIDGRKYGVFQAGVDPAENPVAILERKTETVVGLIMPLVGLDGLNWMPAGELVEYCRLRTEPKPKRWQKLATRLNGQPIDLEDRISASLQTTCARQLLKHAVLTAMTCPECSSVLNLRQSIYWQANKGERCNVRCRSCVKKAIEAEPETVGEFFATAMDVVDGCGI